MDKAVVNERKSFAEAFNVAGVWLATHCGPGCAAGTMVCSYFIAHGGYKAVYYSFLSMIIMGVFYFFGQELCRLTGARTYKELFHVIWGEKIAKFLMVLVDIVTLYCMVVAFGSILAGANKVCNMFLNTPMMLGGLILAIVGAFFCFFGDSLVRKVSGVFTLVLIAAIALASLWCIAVNSETISNLVLTKWQPEGGTKWYEAIYYMFVYIGVEIPFFSNSAVVSDPIKRRKDTVRYVVIGTILNALMVGFITLAIIGFVPEITSEGLPFLYAIQHSCPAWFSWLFFVIYIVALLSTIVSIIYNISARFAPVFEKKLNVSYKKGMAITTVGICLIAYGISAFGILAIIKVAYHLSSIANNIMWTLPFILIVPYRAIKLRKKELRGEIVVK